MNDGLWLWLVICGLAAFRLSELLVIDDGPFDIFFHLRGWSNRPPTGRWRGALAGVLACVHCAGLWMAILVGIFYFSQIFILHAVLFILAIAGLQSLLANRLGRTAS